MGLVYYAIGRVSRSVAVYVGAFCSGPAARLGVEVDSHITGRAQTQIGRMPRASHYMDEFLDWASEASEAEPA